GTDSAEQFFDSVLSGFARIGGQNLSSLFDADGWSASSTAGGAAMLGKAVRVGALEGTEEGALEGFGALLGRNGGMISAGLGGLGLGSQSGNPFMGGIGGALQGFMA